MKKILLITLFTILWAQTTSSGISGFGELYRVHDASSAGMGGSQYFSSLSSGFSFNSPSAMWKTNDVRLGFSTSFSGISNSSGVKLESQLLDIFSFVTPVGKNQAISFGLFPHSRSNYYIKNSQEDADRVYFDDKIFAPAYIYHSEGGISKFYLSYSKLFENGISVGFSWYKNFGNLFLTDSVMTYQVTTNNESGNTVYALNDISASKRTNTFSGTGYALEGRLEKNKLAIVFSTLLQSSFTINSHYQSLVGNSEKDILFSEGLSFTGFGTGVLYKLDHTTGISGEFHYYKPVSTGAELFGIEQKKSINFNSGIFHRFVNSKITGWNFLNVSTGFYTTYNKYSIGDITDFGLTFGLGIEYLNQKNVINIYVNTGKRSTLFDDISNEKYLNLKIGFTVGEHWFVKRRRN
ncbi:MAG: hypothetical protein ACE5D7_06030 [Fidelibacterota bacterium]